MPNQISAIRDKIRNLEEQLEDELEARRQALRFRIERGRVIFDEEVRKLHRAVKAKLVPYVARANPLKLLTAPVIYSMIIPFVILDLFATVYQWICFPAYGIRRVPRSDFIVIDRGSLGYLNAIEKLNCIYCGYANGLIGYVREIASRTEQHWCPIKHARRQRGSHPRYAEFADYGDAEGYRNGLKNFREKLSDEV